jgi:hypothetical protein
MRQRIQCNIHGKLKELEEVNMKTCNRGHRHNESFCPMCRKITRDARYWRKRDSILAKNRAEAEEYKFLKALVAGHEIATGK